MVFTTERFSHSNFIICSTPRFISAIAFVSLHIYFNWNFLEVITSVVEWMIPMVFTTKGFFEVAMESCPEWDLNPQPLNSVQML